MQTEDKITETLLLADEFCKILTLCSVAEACRSRLLGKCTGIRLVDSTFLQALSLLDFIPLKAVKYSSAQS